MATDGTMIDNGSAPSKKKRRGRCGNCGPCHIKDDCGQCKFCQNKQVLKQSCVLRKCVYLRSRPPARGEDCALTGCGRDDDDIDDRHPMSASSAGCPQSPYPAVGSNNSAHRSSNSRQRRRSSYGASDRTRGPGDESSSSPLEQPDGTSPKSSLSSPVSSYDDYVNDGSHGHHSQQQHRKLSIGGEHYPPGSAPPPAGSTTAAQAPAGSMHFESKTPSFSPGSSYALHQPQHVQQPQHHSIQDRSAVAAGQHLGSAPPSCSSNGSLSSSSATLLFTMAPPLFGGMQQPPLLAPPPPSQSLGYMWPLGLAAAAAAGHTGWRGGSGGNGSVGASVDIARHRHQVLPSPQIGGPLLSAFQHPPPSPGPCAVGSWPVPTNQQLMANHFAGLADPLSGVIARHSFGTFRPPLSRSMFGSTVDKRFLAARDYIGGVGITHPGGGAYADGAAELTAAATAALPAHMAQRSGQPPMRDILGTALAQSGIPENNQLCRDAAEDLLADCCAAGDNALLQHDLCDNGGVDSIIASDSQISGLPSRGAGMDHVGQFCEDDFAKISGLAPEWLQMNTFDPVFPLHM